MKPPLAVVAVLVSACTLSSDDRTPPLGDPTVDVPASALREARRCNPKPLRADPAWYGTHRETLTAWLDSRGCDSESYDPAHAPIALFDWDNTVIKNDVGDAITFHMVSHDEVFQPPNHDWKATSGYMTDAGAAALTAACGTAVPPGHRLPTSANLACADEILSMYIDNRTRAGDVAFAGHDFRRMEPTYAWTAQLMAGHTHSQIQRMAVDAAGPQLAAPVGTTQVVGTRTVNAWLRVYEQITDLIKAARSRGYDVWVITASPTDVVRALAPLAGLDPGRVIGIRSLTDHAGKLTYLFEGCGPVPDGNQSMIPYIEGKRCWVNKAIFGDDTAGAVDRRFDPRQVLAAGDSDTDIEFLRDSRYKLVLNRNKLEIMCYAYNNEDGTWLVNPMFIQPRAQRTALYPCSTTACKLADGTAAPCFDDAGAAIPDQADTVF